MSLTTIYSLAFLDAFNFALAIPVINEHVISLGGSFILCGILQSAGAGMQLFASPYVGGLSDTYGRRLVLVSTLAIMFVGDAIAGFNSLPLFFIGRIIYGAAHHTDPLVKATVTDMFPEKETQTKAFNNLLTLPGFVFIIAPIFGGFLHQQFGSFAIISTILCTVDVILIGIVLSYVPYFKKEKKEETPPNRNWFKYFDLLSIKFAVEAAYNFLFMNSGLIFAKRYSLSRTQIGLSIGYMSSTMIIGAVTSGFIKKRFYANDTVGSKRILHALMLMTASFLALLSVNSITLHLAVFIPASLAKMMLEIAWMEALTARLDKSEKGFMMGVATSMLSAAGLVCPLISGILADYIGINILTLLPILPTIVGTILANRIQKQHVN